MSNRWYHCRNDVSKAVKTSIDQPIWHRWYIITQWSPPTLQSQTFSRSIEHLRQTQSHWKFWDSSTQNVELPSYNIYIRVHSLLCMSLSVWINIFLTIRHPMSLTVANVSTKQRHKVERKRITAVFRTVLSLKLQLISRGIVFVEDKPELPVILV